VRVCERVKLMAVTKLTELHVQWLGNCPLADGLLANTDTHKSCEPSVQVAANMCRVAVATVRTVTGTGIVLW
jgi:hypothetical protein